jgi:membrane protein
LALFPNIFKRPLAAFNKQMRNIRVPGAEGASVYDVGTTFFRSIKNTRLSERAAAISFNFLTAIPPTLIFLFSLVPFLPLDSAKETILKSIQLLSPNERLVSSLGNIITDFMSTKRRELISFGFLATIFVSSNGVMGLLRSFERASPEHIKRTGLAMRWKAIRLTFILIFVFLLAIALLIIQSSLLDKYLADIIGNPQVIKLISWISLVFVIYITICIIYRYGPSLRRKFRFFSPGAFMATLLFIVVSYGFFYIANHFVNYNKIYGSLGTLLMLMAWMFITGLVILIGYELNLTILLHHSAEEKEEE